CERNRERSRRHRLGTFTTARGSSSAALEARSEPGRRVFIREVIMPRGKYTGKQERKAEHIEKGYEKRGVGKKEAERRAWATVNKQDKGGKKKGGGGRKKS